MGVSHLSIDHMTNIRVILRNRKKNGDVSDRVISRWWHPSFDTLIVVSNGCVLFDNKITGSIDDLNWANAMCTYVDHIEPALGWSVVIMKVIQLAVLFFSFELNKTEPYLLLAELGAGFELRSTGL